MAKKNTTELGKYISEAREKVGISQRELARRSNMDCAEVSRIESGKRKKPNILYLKGISETLGLSLVKLMKLAGYNDVEINWGKDFSDRRSTADYQAQIKSYEKFYFDVLDDIEQSRKNDFACKGIITDLIGKIENKGLSNDEILESLNEILITIKPNLEKFDKTKYPKFDRGVSLKMKINTNTKLNTLVGKFTDKEK